MNAGNVILQNSIPNMMGPQTATSTGTLRKYAIASDGAGVGVINYNGTVTFHDLVNNIMKVSKFIPAQESNNG